MKDQKETHITLGHIANREVHSSAGDQQNPSSDDHQERDQALFLDDVKNYPAERLAKEIYQSPYHLVAGGLACLYRRDDKPNSTNERNQ